jgi:hypothetical protein
MEEKRFIIGMKQCEGEIFNQGNFQRFVYLFDSACVGILQYVQVDGRVECG